MIFCAYAVLHGVTSNIARIYPHRTAAANFLLGQPSIPETSHAVASGRPEASLTALPQH